MVFSNGFFFRMNNSYECHDVAVESGWRACVKRFVQASTRDPVDAHLQGDAALDPA
jgi:hypothetical protein